MADKLPFNGPVELNGAVTIGGNITSTGTNTYSGGNTHSGHLQAVQVTTTGTGAHSGANTFTGNLTADSVLLNQNGLPFVLLGLNPHFPHNFGQLGAAITTIAAGATQTAIGMVGDLLTQPNTMMKMSLALAGVASQSAVVSAAQANQIFATSGGSGVDYAIGTNAVGGVTPLVTKQVSRITGNITSENVVKTVAAELGTGLSGMILFTGNTITAGNSLKLILNGTNNGYGADYGEIITTGADNGVLTRNAALTTEHEGIILTASGVTTILAGSFLYFLKKDNDASGMAVKGFLRTSGGTIAVTSSAT
jgi:hypothetical protein